jgi:hypothetical protein
MLIESIGRNGEEMGEHGTIDNHCIQFRLIRNAFDTSEMLMTQISPFLGHLHSLLWSAQSLFVFLAFLFATFTLRPVAQPCSTRPTFLRFSQNEKSFSGFFSLD